MLIELYEKDFESFAKKYNLKPSVLSPFHKNDDIGITDNTRFEEAEKILEKDQALALQMARTLESPHKHTRFTLVYGKMGFDKNLFFKDNKICQLTRKMKLSDNEINEKSPKWIFSFPAETGDLSDSLKLMAGISPICPVNLNLSIKTHIAEVLFAVIDIFREMVLKDTLEYLPAQRVLEFLKKGDFDTGSLSRAFKMIYNKRRAPENTGEIEKIFESLNKAGLLEYKDKKVYPDQIITEYIRAFVLIRLVFTCISLKRVTREKQLSGSEKPELIDQPEISGTSMVILQADQHNITGISGDEEQVEFVTISAQALNEMVLPFCMP
jgi:hypothetical protein